MIPPILVLFLVFLASTVCTAQSTSIYQLEIEEKRIPYYLVLQDSNFFFLNIKIKLHCSVIMAGIN